jgi:hypothetical protein
MRYRRETSTIAVAVLLVCVGAPVSAQKLDVKPGLWEITMTEPKSVQRVCYTAEVLNANLSQMPMPPGISCKNDIVQATSKLVVTHTVCTGPMAIEGETRLATASAEAMSMESTSVMTMGGTKQTVKASAAYKWLGANCGDVKPFDPKKLFK